MNKYNKKIKGFTDYSSFKKILPLLLIALLLCFLVNFNLAIILLMLVVLVLSSKILLCNDTILIVLTIFYSLVLEFLTKTLLLPSILKFGIDYLVFLIIIKLIYYSVKKQLVFDRTYIFIGAFILLSFVSAVVNKVNIIQYIYNFEVYYLRYIIVFLGVVNLKIEMNSFYKIIKYLWYFIIFQIPFIYIQDIWSRKNWVPNLSGDIRQDYLSGLIGGRGTTELGLIICFVLSILFILYLKNRISILKFSIYSILFFSIFVISEIKFVLFLIGICFLVIVILNPSKKGYIILGATVLGILISIKCIGYIYPYFTDFLSFDFLKKYIFMEYASSGLSRGDSFIVAGKQIESQLSTALIGNGISGLSKGYLLDENKTIVFQMFTIAQYIFENGYLGLSMILIFYSKIFQYSISLYYKSRDLFSNLVGQAGMLSILLTIVALFYGSSVMKVNFGIIAYALFGYIVIYYKKREISEDNII